MNIVHCRKALALHCQDIRDKKCEKEAEGILYPYRLVFSFLVRALSEGGNSGGNTMAVTMSGKVKLAA